MILFQAANSSDPRPLFIVLGIVAGLCAVPFAVGYLALGACTLLNRRFAGPDEYVVDADNAWIAAALVMGLIEAVVVVFFLATHAKWSW